MKSITVGNCYYLVLLLLQFVSCWTIVLSKSDATVVEIKRKLNGSMKNGDSMDAKALINFQFPDRDEMLKVMDEDTVKIFEEQALLLLLENQLSQEYNETRTLTNIRVATEISDLQINSVQVDSQSILVNRKEDGQFSSSLFVASSVYGSYSGNENNANTVLDTFVDLVFQDKVQDLMKNLQENSLYFEQLLGDTTEEGTREGVNEQPQSNSAKPNNTMLIIVSLLCATAIICTACFVFTRRQSNAGLKFDTVNSHCASSSKMSGLQSGNIERIDLESASISLPSEAHRHCSRSFDSDSILPPSIVSGNVNNAHRSVDTKEKLDHGTIISSELSSYDFYKSRMNLHPGDESQTTVTTDVELNPYEPASRVPTCETIREAPFSITKQVESGQKIHQESIKNHSSSGSRNKVESPVLRSFSPQAYSATVQRIRSAATSRSSSPARSIRSTNQSEKVFQENCSSPQTTSHSIIPNKELSKSPSSPQSPPSKLNRFPSQASPSDEKRCSRPRARSFSLQPRKGEQSRSDARRSRSLAAIRVRQQDDGIEIEPELPVFPSIRNNRGVMASSIEKWMQSNSGRIRRLTEQIGESPASSISTQRRVYDLRPTFHTDDQSYISNASSVTYSSQQGLIPGKKKISSQYNSTYRNVPYSPPPVDLESTISSVSRELEKISNDQNSDCKKYYVDIERKALRVVIDYGEHTDWMPLLYSIKPQSPLYGEAQEGDIILMIDDIDTKGMPADRLAHLVKHCNKENRSSDPYTCRLLLQSGSNRCHV